MEAMEVGTESKQPSGADAGGDAPEEEEEADDDQEEAMEAGEEEEEGVNTSDNFFNLGAGLREGGGSLGDQGSNIVSHC